MPASKPRPVGRPKLTANAKSSILPVRFSADDRNRLQAAAEAEGKRLSEWVRATLLNAVATRQKQV